jgi:F-type H+-transporting ATPase subunit epsilon
MAMTMHVDIVSAEKEIFAGPAEMLTATADLGEVGILPRHSQMLTRLRPGQVVVKVSGSEEQIYYVSGGFLEVQPHIVTVLADTAERARDIDEAAAMGAKERAEQVLSTQTSALEYAKAEAELVQAIAQLRAIERLRKLGKGMS